MSQSRKRKQSPKHILALPDLEQSKAAVLNSLTSKSGQRSYDRAITDFVDWYCSEPRLSFNRTVVLRYRIFLETGRGDPAWYGDFASGFVAKIDPTASPADGITLAPACIDNAASYLNWKLQSVLQTFPQSGFVAPGEIISIFGDNLGPTAGTGTVIDEQGRIVTSLADVTLTFDGVPAPLLYVQASQINAIVPFTVAGKASTMVQLRYNDATSNAARFLVADVVPGIFTIEGRGVQIAAINQDGSLNSAANPAERYSTVSMWATGFGPLSQSYADGQIVYGSPALVVNPPTICFNGHDARFQYFGQAPNLVAGAIQINLILPDVPSGPNQVLFYCMNDFPYGTIYVK